MLQKLNERIQGAVAWIIVSLVTLTFTLFGLIIIYKTTALRM